MCGKKMGTRLLALFLTAVVMVTALPMQGLAYMAEKAGEVTIVDKDGNTITEDASWEETFPYGTFAFSNSQLTVDEGGETGVITLYRLGGTTGRAIAYVSYVPPVAQMEDGSISYANSAGAGDVRIWVEDPLPIAQYQPLGKDPEPLEAETPAAVTASEADPAGEEFQEGDMVLSLDQEAEGYQWQVFYLEEWEDISDAVEATLLVGAEDMETYDFRCIYTVEGQEYGSTSLKGAAYERWEETLPEMPEDIDLDPEITYSELTMDPEDPYQSYVFSVVFAEGEWVKEIHVSAPEDETAEAEKFGLFTIEDCLGGSLYDSANTLTLRVADNDEAGPSTVGFTVTELEVDKAEGTALLTVRREGDTSQVVTVDYETVNGTALAGEDYLAASGSLIFYAGAAEQTIEIQLVDDQVEDETRLDFQVVLTEVKGAGDTCTLENGTATVRLWNSGAGEGDNLASLLQDGEALDVSGGVAVSGNSAAPVETETVTGVQIQEAEAAELAAEIVTSSSGDVDLLTYTYPDTLQFSRSGISDYNSTYWVDHLWYAHRGEAPVNSSYNTVGLSTAFEDWNKGSLPSSDHTLLARTYKNNNSGYATLKVKDTYFSEKYSTIYLETYFEPKWASSLNQFIYGKNEYTYPYVSGVDGQGKDVWYDNGEIWRDDDTLHWYENRYLRMSTDISEIRLGTKRNDQKGSKGDAVATLHQGYLTRNTFANDIQLRVYTANDGDTSGGAAQLTEVQYGEDGLKPKVTIVPGEGGVDSYGSLYVGSKLQLSFDLPESYYVDSSELDFDVFVTKSDGGNYLKTATRSSDGKTYTIEMAWVGMDLWETYTLNVIMSRKQNIVLDVTNSTPRLEDDPSAVDTSRYYEGWSLFWSRLAPGNALNWITYGYSIQRNYPPYYPTDGSMAGNYFMSGAMIRNGGLGTIYDVKNLQWINFNRDPNDRIVFNGRMYAGNETIWLEPQDLTRGTLNFLYYAEDYLSVESAMRVNIGGAALYFDANGNGKIDGYWSEEDGLFVLERDANGETIDAFLFRMEKDTQYDERIFRPIQVGTDSDGNPIYGQFFLKVDYGLTPRCLVPVEGTTVNEDGSERVAQVLPAFITSVTDPDNYAGLTTEQQAYRYIISGQTQHSEDGGYVRSGDGRTMFGPEATATAVIDIPLGGDISPATIVKDADGNDTEEFEWEPDYRGNLLYPFADPAPIYIDNSLAGENTPIAQIEGYNETTGMIDYKPHSESGRTGREMLNGYLGSFAGNDTFALLVQEQSMTTDEIAAANGVTIGGDGLELQSEGGAPAPEPEGSSVGNVQSMPNSEYLKKMEPNEEDDKAEGQVDMSEADSAYPEFNLNMGAQLPTADIPVTDFVTITMDGNQVGFSIGLPLGGFNSSGDAGSGGISGLGEGEWFGPGTALNSSKEDMGKIVNFLKNKDKASFFANSDSYLAATEGITPPNGGTPVKQFSAMELKVNFSLALAFLFEYNPLDNRFYFKQFAVSASAGVEFTMQHRFSPCPILYVYVTVGVGVSIGTGLSVERTAVLGKELLSDEVKEQAANMAKGDRVGISNLRYKSFEITFEGKILIEGFKDGSSFEKDNKYDKARSGYLESDGTETVTVTMRQQGGQTLDRSMYLLITALSEDTKITSIKPVTDVKSECSFDGFSFSPEAFIEAGVGVGIEIAKLEVFIKVSVACSMTLAYLDESGNTKTFEFTDFEFALGLGFRVVILFFSYEMDLISYSITYDVTRPDGTEWQHSWSALGGYFGGDIGTLSATDSSGNTYGVRITLPGNASGSQTIYGPDYGTDGDLDALAYQPTGEDVPFQISGYGSSGDAFKLADGLVSGYDYQVVTANGENYLVYTISRTNANHALDNAMLVLSKLQLTAGAEGDSYGLVNPVDPTSATPYILLDTTDGNGTDDGAGDLEFTAWADANGVIHAAWVSYANPVQTAAPAEPALARPSVGGIQMDGNNYDSDMFKPAAPQREDYYLTVAEYEGKDAGVQANYVPVYAPASQPGSGGTDEPGPGDTSEPQILFYSIKAADGSAAYPTQEAAEAAFEGAQAGYREAEAAYTAWRDYFIALSAYDSDIQAVIDGAAKNTVIKTASFTPGSGAQKGFTQPVVLSGLRETGEAVTGNHLFLPNVVDGTVAVYGKVAQHYTSGELNNLTRDYSAYLTNLGYDPNGTANTSGGNDEATAQIGQYRLTYQTGLWNVYGKQNALCVSVNGVITEVDLPEGQILDNLEAVKIGDTYYVAYTTSENQYIAGGSRTDQAGQADDLLTIKRLFLRTFTIGAEGAQWTDHDSEKAGSNALLLRTLYDYEVNAGSNLDGMYASGTLSTHYTDPYFSNLQFLNAVLGDKLTGESEDFTTMSEGTSEDFLLFEMNGSTYVIREGSLQSIADSHSGSIIPFFTPEPITTQNGNTTQTVIENTTGRSEVTIGADGSGGLAAVYVGTVGNSLSNAIYITRYDPSTGKWGAGTMLATNHMQAYEDAIAYGLSYSEMEKAFLGQVTGNAEYDAYIASADPSAKGGMDYLTFSNLQIALGQKKTETASQPDLDTSSAGETVLPAPEAMSLLSELTEEEQAAMEQADASLLAEGDGSKDTVLVLTGGVLQYLTERQDPNSTDESDKIIAPMSDAAAKEAYESGTDTRGKPGTGVYAISFGVGQQAIGEGELRFASYDFTAGSRLYAYLTFVNTGDVALRGSQADPLIAELQVNGVTLAAWVIPENVQSGQRVALEGTCKALTADLAEGDKFTLRITEDKDYVSASGGVPFEGSFDLLTVGNKVELGFETFSVETTGVDTEGNAQLYVDLEVSNRGSLLAEDVYLQFSYNTGAVDADGEAIYAPLDLTGHSLKVGVQQELPDLQTQAEDIDLQNGILRLEGYVYDESGNAVGASDGDDINAGFYRSVHGIVKAPAEVYCNSNTGGLDLRVEIFSANGSTTTASTAGFIEAVHDEYEISNNVRIAALTHATFYASASRVVLALGNTMRLPVAISTTTGEAPNIAVVEVPKEGEEAHLGVLYYESGAFSKGQERGTLVIAPSTTGSGVIHLQDLNTNDIYAVTYLVTEPGEGINIYNDTDIFNFVGYDPNAVGDARQWYFNNNLISWGTDGPETPMNGDLAYGRVGASFTFDTQAESIRLYFDGEIRVESTFPGFTAQTYSASGGKNGYVDITFGDNQTNYTHTVTVTVTGGQGHNNAYAAFDRVIMEYGSAGTPLPAEDANAPHIYWSRSFPKTASVETGGAVTLEVYVLDDNGLASVTVNGQQPEAITKDEGSGERFWTVPVTVTENGALTVAALDISGNRTTHKIQVDWFNDPVSQPDSVPAFTEAPAFTAVEEHEVYSIGWTASGANGGDITSEVTRIALGEEGTDLVEAPVTPDNGTYIADGNGWYLVTVRHSSDPDEWCAQMVFLGSIDTSKPEVTLVRTDTESQGGEGGADLSWSARKTNSNSITRHTIVSVTLNGAELQIPASQTWVSGVWHATHGGAYTLLAEDSAGNTGTTQYTLENIPVYVEAGGTLFVVTNANDRDRNNGSVTLDPTVLLGGKYDAARSDLAQGVYVGSYQWLLEPAFTFDGDARMEELKAEWLESNPEASEVPEEALAGLAAQVAKEAKEAEEAWLTGLLADDGKWTALTTSDPSTLTGQKAGSYVLFVRDAQDKTNADTLYSTAVTVGDEYITMAVESEPALDAMNNGAAIVEASGGYKDMKVYQYIIRPIRDEEDTLEIKDLDSPLDREEFPEGTYEQPGWVVPDFTRLTDPDEITNTSYHLLSTATLDGLTAGWYQVAVRPMLGVTANDLLALARLGAACGAAANAAEEAAENATETGIARQVDQCITDLRLALNEWQDAEEGADKTNAWNAYVELIGNDGDILTALRAWEEAGFEYGQAQDAYDEAVKAYFTAQVTEQSKQAAASTAEALEAAKTAYETEYGRLMQLAAEAYEGSEGETGWGNAATMTVHVDRVFSYDFNQIEIHDLRYSDDETVTAHFSSNKRKLSDAAEERLISDNATRDLIFTSATMEVRVPAGTLSAGDDLMAMLMPFAHIPEDTTGTVVQCTTPDGEQHYVPWSVITLGKVWYIASVPGTYEIVTNLTSFVDVSGDFWGSDEIGFVAARELFQGVGGKRFDPNGTMTRAMLVTVLGRLAGIDPADYAGQYSFTDVDPDSWYGPYVAWAEQNGVVNGVGGGRFAPNDPITREQLCTMLVRYLDGERIKLPLMQAPPTFSDQADVSGWALEAVDRFRCSGVVQGANGAFLPKNSATRAEVAAIFARLITKVLTDG